MKSHSFRIIGLSEKEVFEGKRTEDIEEALELRLLAEREHEKCLQSGEEKYPMTFLIVVEY